MTESTFQAAQGGALVQASRGERRAPLSDRGSARAEILVALRFWVGVAVVSAATVLADLSLAAGVAGSVLHLAVVLLGWWAIGPRQVAGLALWASALVGLGFGLRLEETTLQIAVVDHAIALLAVWGTAAALIAAKRAQAAARRARAALEMRLRQQSGALAAARSANSARLAATSSGTASTWSATSVLPTSMRAMSRRSLTRFSRWWPESWMSCMYSR